MIQFEDLFCGETWRHQLDDVPSKKTQPDKAGLYSKMYLSVSYKKWGFLIARWVFLFEGSIKFPFLLVKQKSPFSWLRHQGLWTCGTTQTEQSRSFALCGADSFTILWATWMLFQPVKMIWANYSDIYPRSTPPKCWLLMSVRDSTPPIYNTSGKFRIRSYRKKNAFCQNAAVFRNGNLLREVLNQQLVGSCLEIPAVSGCMDFLVGVCCCSKA